LYYSLLGAPSGATINSSSGALSWTPTEVQGPGNYTVTIVVSDTIITDSETITITVSEVNLTPVLNPIGDQSVDEETELTFTVTATDTDIPVQTLSYTLLGAPSGATTNSFSGAFSWTPTEVQGPGNYTITIVVSDTVITDSETITVTVREVNTAPTISDIPDQSTTASVAVGPVPFTVNDADIPTNTLTLCKASSNTDLVTTTYIMLGGSGANRTVTITPTTGVTGTARITITVSDGYLTAHDVFTLSVAAINNAPIANDDSASTPQDTPVTIAVLDNDYDTESDTLFVSAVGPPSNGETTIIGVNIVYTPTQGFSGSDSFTYTISDGELSNTATVSVQVQPASATSDLVISQSYEWETEMVTYTIVARNLGPDAASGAVFTNTLSANVSGVSWTCAAAGGASCTASGEGNTINDTLTSFPAVSIVTYTVGGALNLTDNAVNIASIAPPVGVTDPNEGNNSNTLATMASYQVFLPLVVK